MNPLAMKPSLQSHIVMKKTTPKYRTRPRTPSGWIMFSDEATTADAKATSRDTTSGFFIGLRLQNRIEIRVAAILIKRYLRLLFPLAPCFELGVWKVLMGADIVFENR